MRNGEFRPIGERYEAGVWSDKKGVSYDLVVDKWADSVNYTGFGLHFRALNPADGVPAYEIRLQLPHKFKPLCDGFTEDRSGRPRPAHRMFSVAAIRDLFTRACKEAILRGRVKGPDLVCVQPDGKTVNPLDLYWRTADECQLEGSRCPIVLRPRTKREVTTSHTPTRAEELRPHRIRKKDHDDTTETRDATVPVLGRPSLPSREVHALPR